MSYRESIHAPALRLLGFEREDKPPHDPCGTCNPVFSRRMRQGESSTSAIDEFGVTWTASRHVNLAALGFEDCAATFPDAFRGIELQKVH